MTQIPTIIYQDDDTLVVEKPAGMIVFSEDGTTKNTLIEVMTSHYLELTRAGEAPRYGIVHRLDKDTSGLLMVAKSTKALIFLQKQFKNRSVEKKYLALATGEIKDDSETIHTLIGRSPQDKRKQKAYPLEDTHVKSQREAITEYKVIQRFSTKEGNYTLLEITIKTGRKHQIRCHLAYIHHPIAGDKMYGFKDSPTPAGLTRQFLHASYIKIQLVSGQMHTFQSPLPEELEKILTNLNFHSQ